MIYSCKNISVDIAMPQFAFDEILRMIEKLSDESDNLPFNSEDIGIDVVDLRKFIERLNLADNSIFLVAMHESEPVGFGYLEGGRRARTHHCTNLGIGVLLEYSGCGIGKAIMTALIDYARGTESIAKIELQVRKENQRAIKLYKSCGFEVEGISKRSLFIDGEFYDYVHMGMLID